MKGSGAFDMGHPGREGGDTKEGGALFSTPPV
jgi:hypothetical protein